MHPIVLLVKYVTFSVLDDSKETDAQLMIIFYKRSLGRQSRTVRRQIRLRTSGSALEQMTDEDVALNGAVERPTARETRRGRKKEERERSAVYIAGRCTSPLTVPFVR